MGGCVYINPDVILQEEFGDWNSMDAVIKAANKAKGIRERCLNKSTSMAFETVFSTQEKVDFVQRAKEDGFFVRLFFVCTDDPLINAKRVASRVLEGGHDVPIPKIISRYYRSIACCSEIVSLADRIYFYDNTEAGVDPKLIFRVADGKIVKTYNNWIPWAKSLADTIES